jgi:lysophospholipase L1-like esterase
MQLFSYLALGDSYTIGEAVLLQKNFPYQAVQLLRNSGVNIAAPEIIAKTGWTSGELIAAIDQHKFLAQYDFVSLLIGVNNQYRDLPFEVYKTELEQLIVKSILFAGGKPEHVAILSIPDYSITPFAQSLNKNKIAKEIDEYNNLNKELAFRYKLHYIDNTKGSREDRNTPGFIAPDGLHPSEQEYSHWAKKLSDIVLKSLHL